MRKIYLTRHGQSEANVRELLGGDSSISSLGEKYAKLLPAALLSRLPKDECVSLSVWTSTLRRTIQTASALPFPKLQWKALDELDAGACDGMTYHEIEVDMPEEFAARKKDKLRYRYPEGESYLDVVQRLEPVIAEVEREREYVCIVSHQATLRVMYGYFMGIPQEQIPSLEIPLHTLIELTPMPDGSMHEVRHKVDLTRGPEQFNVEMADRPGSPGSEASCSEALGDVGVARIHAFGSTVSMGAAAAAHDDNLTSVTA